MGVAPLRVAIVGCGLIGQKRARSLGDHTLVVCCDIDMARAEALARSRPGAKFDVDWEAAVTRLDVDTVIICTAHDQLAPIATCAAALGKHVLIEKPGGRRASELDPVLAAAAQSKVCVRVGFNHRCHRAFRKAREIVQSGVLEDLLYVRGRYGHGGRIGYQDEWRADPAISGGGEAIDQGTHLIDLARWFLGDLKLIGGKTATYFWQMPVEDNAFFVLESASRQTAFLHASWTEWKNIFSFEICGRMGKLEISGLGGSYGVERLAHYQMRATMGPPPTIVYEFPMADDSWESEFADFVEDIRQQRIPSPGIRDAQAALRIVEDLYSLRKP